MLVGCWLILNSRSVPLCHSCACPASMASTALGNAVLLRTPGARALFRWTRILPHSAYRSGGGQSRPAPILGKFKASTNPGVWRVAQIISPRADQQQRPQEKRCNASSRSPRNERTRLLRWRPFPVALVGRSRLRFRRPSLRGDCVLFFARRRRDFRAIYPLQFRLIG